MRSASPSWWIERNSVRPLRVRAQDRHHVARLPEIEAVERLVEHEQRLRRQQADREHDATVFALGQLAETRAERAAASPSDDDTASTESRDAPCRPAMNRSTHATVWSGHGRMPSGTKYRRRFAIVAARRRRVSLHAAQRGRRDAGEALKERRLPGAVRSDQPEDLSAADREAGAAQRPEIAEALREAVDRDDVESARSRSRFAELDRGGRR